MREDHELELVTITGARVRVSEGDAIRALARALQSRNGHPVFAASAIRLPGGLVATLSIAPDDL